jgi:hypothetical protein
MPKPDAWLDALTTGWNYFDELADAASALVDQFSRFTGTNLCEFGMNYPTGKSMRPARDRLSSPSYKNILIFRNRKSVYIHDRPAS